MSEKLEPKDIPQSIDPTDLAEAQHKLNPSVEIQLADSEERKRRGKKEDYTLMERLPDENIESFARRIVDTKEEEKESVRVLSNDSFFEFLPRDKETQESIMKKFDRHAEILRDTEEEKERIVSQTKARNEIFRNNPELLNIYNDYLSLENKNQENQQKNIFDYRRYPLYELGDAIRQSLPEIPSDYIRLWRGCRKNEVGYNPQYTNSLEGIALPFLRFYSGVLTYIDIPKEGALRYLSGGAPGAEFILPKEIVKDTKVVGVDKKAEDEIKKKAKSLEELQKEPQGNNPYGYD